MKAMRCGDLMKGCNFVARGATELEVMKKATEHAKAVHGMGQDHARNGPKSEIGDPKRVSD